MKKFILFLAFFLLMGVAKADSYYIQFEKTAVDLNVGDDIGEYLPTAYVSNGVSIITSEGISYTYGKYGITASNIDTSYPSKYSIFCEARSLEYKVNIVTMITFEVHDYEAPVLLGPELIKKRYDEEIDILSIVTATDNSSIDPTVEYSPKDVFGTVGVHTITFTALDSVGNKDEKTVELVVYDNVAPVIECEDFSIEVNETLDITKYATANDAYYGKTQITHETIDTSVLGTKELELTSVDEKGNKALKTVLVSVYDESSPTIELKKENLYVNENYDLKDNIIGIHDNFDKLEIDNVCIKTEKLGNGYYLASYEIADKSGNIFIKKAFVHYTYNNLPVISIVNKEIDLENFNPLDYVIAYDENDGEISNRIIVVDANIEQKYAIYEVYDNEGNITRLRLDFGEEKVTSNDKPVFPVVNEIGDVISNANTIEKKSKTNYWIYIAVGAVVLGFISYKIIRKLRKKMV